MIKLKSSIKNQEIQLHKIIQTIPTPKAIMEIIVMEIVDLEVLALVMVEAMAMATMEVMEIIVILEIKEEQIINGEEHDKDIRKEISSKMVIMNTIHSKEILGIIPIEIIIKILMKLTTNSREIIAKRMPMLDKE